MPSKKIKGDSGKVVGYCRVSTGKQANGLAAQQSAIESYAKAEGKKIVELFVERESGKENGRAVLGQAIAQAKAEGSTLVIAKLDRLSRDVEFLFSLRRAGVDFQALDLPDFNTLTLSVFAGMAQHERELISERTKAGLAEARKCGHIGGNPNGFNSLARSRAIEARKGNAMMDDRNEQAKKFIEMSLEEGRFSYREIAARLNRLGFVTRKGQQYNAGSVQRIIKLYGLRPETATDTKGEIK